MIIVGWREVGREKERERERERDGVMEGGLMWHEKNGSRVY